MFLNRVALKLTSLSYFCFDMSRVGIRQYAYIEMSKALYAAIS
jgi:hypothetical protein